jgi:hypothetical protein
MPDSQDRPLPQISRSTWLTLAAVVVSLGVFVATYLAYFMRQESGAAGSYLPLTIGVGSFVVLMGALNYVGFASSQTHRLGKAVAFTLVEAFAFLFAFMLLLLNTLGS